MTSQPRWFESLREVADVEAGGLPYGGEAAAVESYGWVLDEAEHLRYRVFGSYWCTGRCVGRRLDVKDSAIASEVSGAQSAIAASSSRSSSVSVGGRSVVRLRESEQRRRSGGVLSGLVIHPSSPPRALLEDGLELLPDGLAADAELLADLLVRPPVQDVLGRS